MTMDENTRAKYEEKIKTLLAMAKKKKNVLEYQEISDHFADLHLEEEQMDEILDALEKSVSKSLDTVSDMVAEELDGMAKQQKLDFEKNHLAELIAHADAAIDTVPDPKMRRVLKLYYLENLSTKEVAEKMNYTVQHVNRLMNKGLEMVQLPEDEVIPA